MASGGVSSLRTTATLREIDYAKDTLLSQGSHELQGIRIVNGLMGGDCILQWFRVARAQTSLHAFEQLRLKAFNSKRMRCSRR